MSSDIKLGPGLKETGGSPFTFKELDRILTDAAKVSAVSMAATNSVSSATHLEIRPEGSFITCGVTSNKVESLEAIRAISNLLKAIEDHSTTNSAKSEKALEMAKRKFDSHHLNNIKAALSEICRSERREIVIELDGEPLIIAVPHKASIQFFNSSRHGTDAQKKDCIDQIQSRKVIETEEGARLLLLESKISTESLRPGKRLKVKLLKDHEAISFVKLPSEDDPNERS